MLRLFGKFNQTKIVCQTKNGGDLRLLMWFKCILRYDEPMRMHPYGFFALEADAKRLYEFVFLPHPPSPSPWNGEGEIGGEVLAFVEI